MVCQHLERGIANCSLTDGFVDVLAFPGTLI